MTARERAWAHAAIDDLLHTRHLPRFVRQRCYQARIGTYAMIDARKVRVVRGRLRRVAGP